MKTVSKILIALSILISSSTSAQTLFSEVIKDCIKFKQNGVPSSVIQFSFTVNSTVNGIITSSGLVFMDLSTKTNQFGQKVTFLKSKPSRFTPSSSSSTYIAESNSTGLLINETSDVVVITLTSVNSNGTVTNQRIRIRNNQSVIKISLSGSGETSRNEYIVYGIIDPSNPNAVITLRFRQGFNLIEGII